MARCDVAELVRAAVVQAAGIRSEDFHPGLTLGFDLGLGSLELLEIFFSIEHSAPQALSLERCARYLQGPVPDDEFCDERGLVSPRGLEWLRTIMPQLDSEALSGKLHQDRILPHLTVQDLVVMLEALLEDGPPCQA